MTDVRKQIQTLKKECHVLIEAEIGVWIYKSKNTTDCWQASLIAQSAKNLPAMQETRV